MHLVNEATGEAALVTSMPQRPSYRELEALIRCGISAGWPSQIQACGCLQHCTACLCRRRWSFRVSKTAPSAAAFQGGDLTASAIMQDQAAVCHGLQGHRRLKCQQAAVGAAAAGAALESGQPAGPSVAGSVQQQLQHLCCLVATCRSCHKLCHPYQVVNVRLGVHAALVVCRTLYQHLLFVLVLDRRPAGVEILDYHINLPPISNTQNATHQLPDYNSTNCAPLVRGLITSPF